MSELTQALNSLHQGKVEASDRLFLLVYHELRQLASVKMARESADHTLQPTALVHEAWLRLGGDDQPEWANRDHFFAAAAEAMRRILIDRARTRAAKRHGGGLHRVDLEEIDVAAPDHDDELLAVNEALAQFAAVDPVKAELVKMRYFAGLTLKEISVVLDISEKTARRWWTYSRTWLFAALQTDRANKPRPGNKR